MNENFNVAVGEFEGPIDLLLQLIEKKKLHISEVALAEVAESFIGHMKDSQKTISKAHMADFIYVASTLMLIKSIALLPTIETTPEEKASIEELERRLAEFKKIKELSVHISERFGQKVLFAPERRTNLKPVFTPSPEITSSNLLQTVKDILSRINIKEVLPQVVVKKIISLSEVMSNLTTRIQGALKISFKQFVGNSGEKVNVIVSFLGMLELVKQGMIDVTQEEHFEDIQMEAIDTNVPKYV